MNKLIIYIGILCLASQSLMAQSNTTPCGAKWLDLSGLETGKTPQPTAVPNTNYPICNTGTVNGTIDNPLWYKFTTNGASAFEISAKAMNCSAASTDKGVTVSVFRQRTAACSDLVLVGGANVCNKISDGTTGKVDFVPIGNKTYWVLVDGIAGSQCDFSLAYDKLQLGAQTSELNINLFWDKDKNCQLDLADKNAPFNEVTVLMKQGGNLKYTLRPNEAGKIKTNLLSGIYDLELRYANALWTTCSKLNAINIAQASVDMDILLQAQKQCSSIESDLSTTCVENNKTSIYRINYKNIGTEELQNAQAILTLDEAQTLLSASKPFSAPIKNQYTFNIGKLAALENGFIEFKTKNTSNVLVQKAIIHQLEIVPNPLCETPSGAWDKSDLQVMGTCANNLVSFTVKNVGTGNSAKADGIIIEDILVGKTQPIDPILPNGIFTIDRPANGKTYRFEVPQSPNHPRKSMPSVTIEGCGKNTSGSYSVSYANQYPQDDAEPSIDIDLREVEENAVLNDILAFPRGYGNEHYILPNQDIEYIIRFKNYKQDSIKRLYIVDTLPAGLDISSLRMGNSSHRNELIISDNRILTFAFDNINLQPVNSAGGDTAYVKFRISQVKDLPQGTILQHRPMFYTNLDSSPLVANSVKHTIGKNFITVSSIETFIPKAIVRVYPNPTSDVAHISIENMEAHNELQLEIFDLSARLLHTAKSNSNQFDINVNDLPKGLYFFRISDAKQVIANGKLIINN